MNKIVLVFELKLAYFSKIGRILIKQLLSQLELKLSSLQSCDWSHVYLLTFDWWIFFSALMCTWNLCAHFRHFLPYYIKVSLVLTTMKMYIWFVSSSFNRPFSFFFGVQIYVQFIENSPKIII